MAHNYITDVEHAARSLLDAIYYEEDQLKAHLIQLSRLEDEIRQLQYDADFLAINPDLDDEGLGTFKHWHAYFDVEPQRDKLLGPIEILQKRITVREFSARALSGGLLQIAKQGMSMSFGPRLEQCPNEGRAIESQSLKTVVWQARNQAMHFDEGTFRNPKIPECFVTLSADFRQAELADVYARSLALDVIRLLGWTTFEAFSHDLTMLLGP